MDIDIDFPTSFDPITIFETAVNASRVQDGELKKHNAGIYFQHIPVDQITGYSAIPYNEAENLGYIKIDFLHLSFLDIFQNKHQLRVLLKKEPDWSMLADPNVVGKLFQLHSHFALLSDVKPTSVLEIADCISLIRPAKLFLKDKYLKAKKEGKLDQFRTVLYAKPADGGIYYKKPHSVAYALTIVLQLHFIKAGII